MDVPDEDLHKAYMANNGDSTLPKSTDRLIGSGYTNHTYHDRDESVEYENLELPTF